jgi:hypothetical protein
MLADLLLCETKMCAQRVKIIFLQNVNKKMAAMQKFSLAFGLMVTPNEKLGLRSEIWFGARSSASWWKYI